MANGTKELNTSPITIEDEINEFSEKPVQGKTLYKKLKELEDGTLPDTTDASVGDALVLDEDKKPKWATGGGGSPFGKTIFSGTVTDTPQPIEITHEEFWALPKYVGMVNGKSITYMEMDRDEDGAYWYIGNEDGDEVEIVFTEGGIIIVAYDDDCEFELIDMGARFVSIPGRLQGDTIHVGYPIHVLDVLATAGCGLGLCVTSNTGGADGHSYAPIVLYYHPIGNYFFEAYIRIGAAIYSAWTVDPSTGAITGTTGGSN